MIDKSGKWWVGGTADDIGEYLRAYQAEGYEVDETRICKCSCGSTTFKLRADKEEGCAERVCTACGVGTLICDSGEYWEDATPEQYQCTECGSTDCNVGAGFSLYPADEGPERDVRWISVGVRCANCGTLGCIVDWKIGYGPSYQFLEKV